MSDEHITEEEALLPLNSIGNVLGVEILNQSIQHAEAIVNRAEEIENELFSLPMRIQNLNWKQFCDINANFKLAGTNFEKELSPDQVILFDDKTIKDNTRIMISHPDHQIPNIEHPDNSQIYVKNDKNVINAKGFILDQRRGNMGLTSYIPFLPGKKVIGLYVRRSSVNQFYYVGIFKTETSVPNISIDRDIITRNTRDVLTDTDKVVVSNASSRFRNQVQNWYYLKDALDYFNRLLFQTIDPSYINKLMVLNKTLSTNIR